MESISFFPELYELLKFFSVLFSLNHKVMLKQFCSTSSSLRILNKTLSYKILEVLSPFGTLKLRSILSNNQIKYFLLWFTDIRRFSIS